ncbi:MAG: hypothetical protein ABIW57_07445 [Polyangia bacterium]
MEQVPVQVVCAEQLTWQGGALQLKLQLLPLPQLQVPLAHSASQRSLSPAHRAWHGGAAQVKLQLSPPGQAQVPLLQSPLVRHPGMKAAAAAAVVTMKTTAR